MAGCKGKFLGLEAQFHHFVDLCDLLILIATFLVYKIRISEVPT